jgi:hypothetical protein
MSGMVSEAVSVRQSQNRLPTVRLILRGRYWQNKASPSARTGDPDFERPRLRSSALILRLFSVGCGLRGALFGRLVSLPQLHAGLIQAANTPPGRLAQSSAAACCPTRLTDDIARPHGANRALISGSPANVCISGVRSTTKARSSTCCFSAGETAARPSSSCASCCGRGGNGSNLRKMAAAASRASKCWRERVTLTMLSLYGLRAPDRGQSTDLCKRGPAVERLNHEPVSQPP